MSLTKVLSHLRRQYLGVLALLIVLGGGAYALATDSIGGSQSENDSIRSRNIRHNQVSSRHVKNHSLLARDFRAGELPIGSGRPREVRTDIGTRGPSHAYHLRKNATVPLTAVPEFKFVEVASLTGLPAGMYLIEAHVVAAKRGASTLIRCRITAAGQTSAAPGAAVGEEGAAFIGAITVTMPISARAPYDAVLLCDKEYTGEPEKETYVESIAMQAIKVGALDVRTAPSDR